MIENAAAAGLAFNKRLMHEDVKPNSQGKLYNSKEGIFAWLPGYIRPIHRATETINASVFERMKQVANYRPTNVTENWKRDG